MPSKSGFISAALLAALLLSASYQHGVAQVARHTFALGESEFLLDGKQFQIISGELHPARIPREYWQHRIRMAKAMGCNTIAAYIFWNYHEREPGVFDFSTGNRDIGEFLRIAREEGMWVLVRPGPYVCAEWDFGGLPSYLLKIPDIKVRCMDPRYMEAVERYVAAFAAIIKPLLVTRGGPVLMVQIENEYGSFGNDRAYLERLRELWKREGVDVPFYTADGPTPAMLEAGNIAGAAIGLDSGSDEKAFDEARRHNPRVPAFSSETYPGWLTHWGENWARPDTAALMKEVRFLLQAGKSFNFYVIHGGTNFGFTAGANSGGKGYEPDVTSYDYDAPVNEQGRPTPKYFALRDAIAHHLGRLPDVPASIDARDIPPVPMRPFTSLWANLPAPVSSVQPKPFEAYGQDHGFALYRTRLVGHKRGTLVITELHDYATVFLNGRYIGKIDRREGEKSIEVPASDVPVPVLEILVEGMGRINFAAQMIDRKGITDRVTLNGMTLMNWDVHNLQFDEKYLAGLQRADVDTAKKGWFFKGVFDLAGVADTFFDMSGYRKGIVWINGHNLGRFWDIGPQKRLYCPASWLKKGENTLVVFDLHAVDSPPIRAFSTAE